MKRARDSHAVVVQAVAVERHPRTGRATTEQHHAAAAGRQLRSLLPDLDAARALHHQVGPPAPRELVKRSLEVVVLAQHGVGAQPAGHLEPERPSPGYHHPAGTRPLERHQPQQRNGAGPEQQDRGRLVAITKRHARHAVAHRRQRLEQGGVFKGQVIGTMVNVAAQHPLGNEQVLRVSAQDHLVHQALAEVLLAASAVATVVAGAGVGRHQLVVQREAFHCSADLDHTAGKLVAEGRRTGHLGVAATPGLQVGAAGERRAHLEHDVAWTGPGVGRVVFNDDEPGFLQHAALHGCELPRAYGPADTSPADTSPANTAFRARPASSR